MYYAPTLFRTPGDLMKLSLTILSLVLSANVSAYSLADSSVLTSATPLLSSATTSGAFNAKQAALVLNDTQEFIQSGKMSAFLGQKIKDAQALNEGASQEDALDMLINEAEALLN
jgi:hypothetical protein